MATTRWRDESVRTKLWHSEAGPYFTAGELVSVVRELEARLELGDLRADAQVFCNPRTDGDLGWLRTLEVRAVAETDHSQPELDHDHPHDEENQ